MKLTRILCGWVMLSGVAFSVRAQTITTTPTNGLTTIAIHARTTDGKVPPDVSCKVAEPERSAGLVHLVEDSIVDAHI